MSLPEPDEFVTGGMSDIGRVREVNQDYCGEFDDPHTRRRLWMVADGMGGHVGGEVASKMAVETVAEIFHAGGGNDATALLREALETANQRVHKAAQADMTLNGMGTTGVCLLFERGGRGCVAHVGDSRAYRLRGEQLEQITEDHSVVAALIRMGHISEAEAKRHPQRNEILRAIGTHDQVEVQIAPLDIQRGDQYLLCSDGLSSLVPDADIADVLRRMEPREAVRNLVQRANLEGGNDNITVQVVRIPSELPDAAARDRSATQAPRSEERRGPPRWVWAAAVGIAGPLLWLLLWLLLGSR
jgi:protein phosphatase